MCHLTVTIQLVIGLLSSATPIHRNLHILSRKSIFSSLYLLHTHAVKFLIFIRRNQLRKSAGTQNNLTENFVNFLSPTKHMQGQ